MLGIIGAMDIEVATLIDAMKISKKLPDRSCE